MAVLANDEKVNIRNPGNFNSSSTCRSLVRCSKPLVTSQLMFCYAVMWAMGLSEVDYCLVVLARLFWCLLISDYCFVWTLLCAINWTLRGWMFRKYIGDCGGHFLHFRLPKICACVDFYRWSDFAGQTGNVTISFLTFHYSYFYPKSSPRSMWSIIGYMWLGGQVRLRFFLFRFDVFFYNAYEHNTFFFLQIL